MSPSEPVIMTKNGWRPLLPPMAPVPPPPKWGTFPAAAGFDALFIGGDGKDVRVTGNWYHVLRNQGAR